MSASNYVTSYSSFIYFRVHFRIKTTATTTAIAASSFNSPQFQHKASKDVWRQALVICPFPNPTSSFTHKLTTSREQDKEATVYIGNIDERVTDSLVWELMLQAGRIVNVHLPKDRVSQNHQGYGFVEFISEEDAEYAARIMNQVRLYGKPIRVNKVRSLCAST
jgi:RNA recognition motif-containing protein